MFQATIVKFFINYSPTVWVRMHFWVRGRKPVSVVNQFVGNSVVNYLRWVLWVFEDAVDNDLAALVQIGHSDRTKAVLCLSAKPNKDFVLLGNVVEIGFPKMVQTRQ